MRRALLLAALLAACSRTEAPDVGARAAAQSAEPDVSWCAPAPTDAGLPDASPPPEPTATDRLFDDDAPPRLLRIEVAPADLAYLRQDPRREQYVPATVVFEGQRYEGAAVRYKGGYGSLYACFDAQGNLLCPRLSLKVSFNEYDGAGRFQGVRKLVLNCANRDDTYLHERLSYRLFEAAGLLASRVVHARVQINDEPESLYVLVENIDKEWLQDRFADDEGNLYKEVWPQHRERPPYENALRTHEDAPDVARMVAFAWLLQDLDDAEFVEAVEPWIDRDYMARYIAVDHVIHNWDGIWKFYCTGASCGNHNYYIYDDPTSGRLWVTPWDLDHTFNRPWPDYARAWWDDSPETCRPLAAGQRGERRPQCDPLLRGLIRHGWDLYRARLDELTAEGGPLGEAAILARLDRYRAQIEPHLDGDPQGPGLERWRRAVSQLRQVIRVQVREARAFIREGQ